GRLSQLLHGPGEASGNVEREPCRNEDNEQCQKGEQHEEVILQQGLLALQLIVLGVLPFDHQCTLGDLWRNQLTGNQCTSASDWSGSNQVDSVIGVDALRWVLLSVGARLLPRFL